MGPFMGWNLKVAPSCTTTVMSPVGSPKFHARWSISPSTWQDAQEFVPLPESLPSYKKPRPPLTVAGSGSVPTAISLVTAIAEALMMEIVSEIRFIEYSVDPLRANPLGPRLATGSTLDPCPLGGPTSTNDNTFPLVSTCATRSVPKDATYMKFPLGSKTTPAGCDSAVLNACGLGRTL